MPNFCRCQCSERLLGEVHLHLNCQSPQLNGWLTWNVLRMCRVDFPVWRYWNRTYPTTSPGRKRTSVFTICMCSNCSIHIKGLNWSGITLCIKRPWIMKHETEPLAFDIGIKFWSSPCNQGIIMKKTLGTAGGEGGLRNVLAVGFAVKQACTITWQLPWDSLLQVAGVIDKCCGLNVTYLLRAYVNPCALIAFKIALYILNTPVCIHMYMRGPKT